MAKLVELKFISTGGLDFDSKDSKVLPEDYRNAENMRNSVSYTGQQFVPCNMKGNVLVAYNMSSADCRCLGGVEDKQFNTILYFVWSSDSKHKVLRYYPKMVDNAHPFGQIQLLAEFDFKWKKYERITGVDFINGQILCWTDSVQPRAFDVIKANTTNKFKKWTVQLPVTTSGADTFQIVIRDIHTNIPLFSLNVSVSGNREEKFSQLAAIINDPAGALHNYISSEACTCDLKITETHADSYNVVFTLPDYKVVPENWYGLNLVNRFFDACKFPPGCNPLPAYKIDANVNYNFVRDKVFFFRLGYEYENFEGSALGPVSNVITNNQVCNEGAYNAYNYIDIDFNDPDLLDPNIWVILKKVGIYVKEHNTGDWLKVGASIDVCDFFDLVDGTEAAHFKFYNNINTSAISTILSGKQYDNLPRLANGQKFAKNKLTYAGITEGYDSPACVEAELDLAFEDVGQQEYFDCSFIVRICNPAFDGSSNNSAGISKMNYQVGFSPALDNSIINILNRMGAIVRNDGSSYPMYGGVGSTGGGISVGTNQSGWEQLLPMGGFLFYAAGEPFYAISRQVNKGGLTTDEFGAFLTVAPNDAKIQAFYNDPANAGEVYSVVTIRLPRGRHCIRMASHLCSDGDILKRGKIYDINNGLYGLTSGNVFRFNDPAGNFIGDTELVINVTQDEFFGEVYVADRMLPNHNSLIIRNVYGYLIDATMFQIQNQVTKAIGLERQTVAVSFGGAAFDPSDAYPISTGTAAITYTDHNGYFFVIFGAGGGITGCTICAVGANNQIIAQNADAKYYGDIGQVYDNVLIPQGTPLSFNNNGAAYLYNNPRIGSPDAATYYNILGQVGNASGPNLVDITQVCRAVIILNTNSFFRRDYSTVVFGHFKDANGTPICCVNVAMTEVGRTSTSDHAGKFNILAFANGEHTLSHGPPDGNYFPIVVGALLDSAILEHLVFSSGACVVTFNTPYPVVAVSPIQNNPGTVPPPYSSTAFYDAGDFICQLINSIFIKTAKRGGKYKLVLRYQDLAGRQCSCVEGAEIYIPFFGEDLHKYFPTQFPAGTFASGAPVITWTLPVTFKPPVWAAKYQWMRTKNLHQADYLQWLINDVKYVVSREAGVPVETSYNTYNANQIWISLSNIQTYLNIHPSSNVQFQFAVGQRVRFIANEKGVDFQQYVDVRVTGIQDNWLILDYFDDLGEVKTAMWVELVTEKKINALDLYYECGACYECTHPGFSDNAHSVLSAPFEWGDTYWVNRTVPIRDTTDIAFNANLIYFMESPSISDFYVSRDEDLGREGIISDKYRELYRGGAFRISNEYIPNTGINGICNFDNIDDPELGAEFGPIRSLQISGFVMAAICENKMVSNYLGAVQGATPIGELVIASQQGYIGDSRPLIGDFGTQHPATVVEKDGWIWGVDFGRGIAWKQDNNGLDVISDKKAKTFFNLLSQAGIWDAVAGFDAFYMEYIVSAWINRNDLTQYVDFAAGTIKINSTSPAIYQIGDTVEISFTNTLTGAVITAFGNVTFINGTTISIFFDTQLTVINAVNVNIRMRGAGVTIAYHKEKLRWTTKYSYLPDTIIPVGFDLVTWKNGQLYLHDVGPIGTFYGVYYKWKLKLCVYSQGYPELLWNSIQFEQLQNDQNKSFNWAIPVINNAKGQLSRLVKHLFVRGEEYWNTAFKKNLNTLSASNPIVDGEDLRSSELNLEMENDATQQAELRSLNIFVQESSGNR